MNSQKMDLKATVVFGEAPESDDDTSSIVTVCHCYCINSLSIYSYIVYLNSI
jgi:hypothetical protein